MACALMGVWIRSNLIEDRILASYGTTYHSFALCQGVLSWWRVDGFPVEESLEWKSYGIEGRSAYEAQHHPWYFDSRKWNVAFYVFPFPLTIVSACLLLWKRRQ